MQALAAWHGYVPPKIPEDVVLRNAVMANLEKESWAHIALISVTAQLGLIDLSGLVESQLQRDAIPRCRRDHSRGTRGK